MSLIPHLHVNVRAWYFRHKPNRTILNSPEGVIGTLNDEDDLSVMLLGDMLLLLLLLCGLRGGRLFPRASGTGRLPLTVTAEELVDVVLLLLMLLLLLFVVWEERSILDPVRRTSLLARRHLSLSICTWREKKRVK